MAYINGNEILFSPIINIGEFFLNGTFVFKDNADIANCPNEAVNFDSNGGSFTGMYAHHETASYYLNYERAGGYETVCESINGNTWVNDQYKIITFNNEKVTALFYSWFMANASVRV